MSRKYKSPLTEVDMSKTRSARPQEGWINPLFRGPNYKGPADYHDPDKKKGWTIMDKVRKIVGGDNFEEVFNENQHYKHTDYTETDPPDLYAGIDKEKLLQPTDDPYEYLQNDDGSYSTRKKGTDKWANVTLKNNEAAFNAINKLFNPEADDLTFLDMIKINDDIIPIKEIINVDYSQSTSTKKKHTDYDQIFHSAMR